MTSSYASAVFRRTSFVGRTDSYMPITPNALTTRQMDLALTGQTPFDVSGSLMTDPYVQDAISRLNRYKEFLDFYAGRHHAIQFESGERKVAFNYPRRIVNKRATWIAGRHGFQFVPRKGNEAVCEVLEAVWKANKKRSLLRRTAKVSLTCGDAFWYVTVKTKDRDGKELPQEKWHIRICPLNPAYVFPLWREDDPNEMRACMVQFPVWSAKEKRTELFTAIYTQSTVEMYSNNVKQGGDGDGKNILGFIPIIHIPNGSFNDMPFGISALTDVIDPVRDYNDTMMRIKKIVKYHADPTTIVYGTSLAKMEKAANRVWSNLPPPDQARVENLEMRSDLSATYTLLEKIKDEILEAGCTPQIAFEARNLATSNSSGLAIQLLFQPLLEVTDEAQDEYTEAVHQTNRVISSIYDKIFGLPLSDLADSEDDFLESDLRWPSMLPRDLTQEADQIAKMLDMKIISRAEAARRLTGVTDTERAALEIAADEAASLATSVEVAKGLNGGTPSFTAVTMSSLFINEDLLDIAGKIGDIASVEGKSTGAKDEPED